MYGSTLGVNLILFFLVFPLLANFSLTGAVEQDVNINDFEIVKIKSNIPCPGHAPLISTELRAVEGVIDVKYSFPNNFEVRYDKIKTSTNKILELEIFKEYSATLIST